MPQSLTQLYIHLVFSTKNRECTIPDLQRETLAKYMSTVLDNMECPLVARGIQPDHVHILFRLSKNCAIKDAIEEVKRASSKWFKQKPEVTDDFYWQAGYGAFSVSTSRIYDVTRYIETQDEHHKAFDFKEEFVRLLEKHGVDFDERYLW